MAGREMQIKQLEKQMMGGLSLTRRRNMEGRKASKKGSVAEGGGPLLPSAALDPVAPPAIALHRALNDTTLMLLRARELAPAKTEEVCPLCLQPCHAASICHQSATLVCAGCDRRP